MSRENPIDLTLDDEVIDLTSNLVTVRDERCCLCFDDIIDNSKYFTPPCGHLYCRECMMEKRLSRCTRCNQPFIDAVEVTVKVVA